MPAHFTLASHTCDLSTFVFPARRQMANPAHQANSEDEGPRAGLVGGKYEVKNRIAAGTFCTVYICKNVITDEEVALRVDTTDGKHLEFELRVNLALDGGIGIPRARWQGEDNDGHQAIAVDLLGPSLEDLFGYCGRKFSLKTVLTLAYQMFARIEHLHDRSFVHRDIKPHAFCMGLGKLGNQVHLVGLGTAKMYRDPKTRVGMPYADKRSLTGTWRFSSIRAMQGVGKC